jgi:hypothetical protein
MDMKRDYYAALDVPPSAGLDEILRAYRLCRDSYTAESTATYGLLNESERDETLALFEEARRVLCDVELRRAYDRQLVADGYYTENDLSAPANGGLPAPGAPLASAEAASTQAKPAPSLSGGTETPAPAPSVAAEKSKSADAVLPDLQASPIGGAQIKAVREARGLSIHDIGNQTKISTLNLQFIEACNYEMLPAPVYLRGFLKAYARALRIDPEKTAADYMRAYEAYQQGHRS